MENGIILFYHYMHISHITLSCKPSTSANGPHNYLFHQSRFPSCVHCLALGVRIPDIAGLDARQGQYADKIKDMISNKELRLLVDVNHLRSFDADLFRR